MGWFGGSYKEFNFEMFSVSHFVIIALLFLGSFLIYINRITLKAEMWRKAEVVVGLSLLVMELTYHFWMVVNDMWDVSHAIPLELCSISLVLSVLLLLTRKRSFTKYCYLQPYWEHLRQSLLLY